MFLVVKQVDQLREAEGCISIGTLYNFTGLKEFVWVDGYTLTKK